MNVPRLDDIWTLARKSPMGDLAPHLNQKVDDQLLLRSVNVTYPNEVHILSDAWDLSATVVWQPKIQKTLASHYPNVGMLHFNGGGESKESYFGRDDGFLTWYPETWGNAKYYVMLPWQWARFQAKSAVRPGSDGYLISITFS